LHKFNLKLLVIKVMYKVLTLVD